MQSSSVTTVRSASAAECPSRINSSTRSSRCNASSSMISPLRCGSMSKGASRLRTFRSVTLPLLLPAVVSAFLIAFTTSFDEYAVASFVVGSRVTFPIYLYAALRFPNQLPQVIAVAVVVITISLVVVVGAELGRRVAERRLGATEG